MTKKERYYIDTSVIGGCLDDEFRKASKLLIKEFSEGRKVAIISDITRAEISRDCPSHPSRDCLRASGRFGSA